MRQYNALWEHVKSSGGDRLTLTFEEIRQICGRPIGHSFLNCKKELAAYGWRVGKISLKGQTVAFERI